MRILVLCLLLMSAAACTRPLSEREAAVGRAVFGDSLDIEAVRIAAGYGLRPAPGPAGFATRTVKGSVVRCIQEAKRTTGERPPVAAFVRFQTIHYLNGWYRGDLMDTGGADGVPLVQLLTFVHELVHVWQWQNREKTGYHPLRGFSESVVDQDPYFYKLSRKRGFHDYGYEQQARMVEDFLCLKIVDPGHRDFRVLKQILAPEFPLAR